MTITDPKKVKLYRMVMADHICPYGLKSKDLLERRGFDVEDHNLKTREETDAFQKEHNVETTPQTWINGKRVGGYGELREYFDGKSKKNDEANYQPVIAIFSVSFLLAIAMNWKLNETILNFHILEWFISFAMCLLAVQKLQDVENFSTMFLNYDLLARKWVRYSYLYPFGELFAGILMISGTLFWISSPIALFIGTLWVQFLYSRLCTLIREN